MVVSIARSGVDLGIGVPHACASPAAAAAAKHPAGGLLVFPSISTATPAWWTTQDRAGAAQSQRLASLENVGWRLAGRFPVCVIKGQRHVIERVFVITAACIRVRVVPQLFGTLAIN